VIVCGGGVVVVCLFLLVIGRAEASGTANQKHDNEYYRSAGVFLFLCFQINIGLVRALSAPKKSVFVLVFVIVVVLFVLFLFLFFS